MIIVVAGVGIYLGTILISKGTLFSLRVKIKKGLKKQNYHIKENIDFTLNNSICSSLELMIPVVNLRKIYEFIKEYDKKYERCKIKLLQDKKIVPILKEGAYARSATFRENDSNENKIEPHSNNSVEEIRSEKEDLMHQKEKLEGLSPQLIGQTYNEELDEDVPKR